MDVDGVLSKPDREDETPFEEDAEGGGTEMVSAVWMAEVVERESRVMPYPGDLYTFEGLSWLIGANARTLGTHFPLSSPL